MAPLLKLMTLVSVTCCFLSVSSTAQAAGDCRLASFRERVDKIRQSMTVEGEESVSTTNAADQPYQVVDLKISGYIDGCVVLDGPVPKLQPGYSWLYDVPDISLPQEHLMLVDRTRPYPLPLREGDGNTSPRYYAEGRFEARDGSGIRFFFPERRADWNGKLFLVQHGSGIYTRAGDEMVTREPGAPFPHGSGKNLYIENMIDKGFAVAYLRKDSARAPRGASKVTLRDGKIISTTFGAHVALPLAQAEFAQNFIKERLGTAPQRTYWYGHSGGGITGRLINQAAGSNLGQDGTPVIDGFLLDDTGGGLYVPVKFQRGKDVLFEQASERATFVPQIEFVHQLYNPSSYLEAKRLNAILLRQKGLADRHRLYEISGTSHFDSGMIAGYAAGMDPRATPLDLIDRSPLVHALIDLLDRWVEKGTTPPPSKASVPSFDPPVALPEVACPLGVYHAPGGGGTTRFLAFDGKNLEPVLETPEAAFLDINGNGRRDTRETVTAAWIRLGLIQKGETVDEARYAQCVAKSTRALMGEGLLPAGADRWFASRIRKTLQESGAALN